MTTHYRLCVLLAAGLAIVGCGGDGDAKTECLTSIPCVENADCLAGQHCNKALSVPMCQVLYCGDGATQCSENELCISQVCDGGFCDAPKCVPDCGSAECGFDPVCGTKNCGICGDGKYCQSGACTSDSKGYVEGYIDLMHRLQECGIFSNGRFPVDFLEQKYSDLLDEEDEAYDCIYNCWADAECSVLETGWCSDGDADSSPLKQINFECGLKCIGSFSCDDHLWNKWDDSICNGTVDCSDGSDEVDCPTFKCGNGEVILTYFRCDSNNDCGDGSDEVDCPGLACADGTTARYGVRCDGERDCPDGSDEPADCPTFRCGDGSTVFWGLECDGIPNCPDASDEIGCARVTCPDECTPQCGGAECGLDSVCGESCGTCDAWETCRNGVCVSNSTDVYESYDVPTVSDDGCNSNDPTGYMDCSDIECGPDRLCGHSCGSCEWWQTCEGGHCVETPSEDVWESDVPSEDVPSEDQPWYCEPDCGDTECGMDPVCGVLNCGTCPDSHYCQYGKCVCKSVPDCTDRACLDNGCGEICPCDGVCLGSICCVPNCLDKDCGDDGCGGSCGDCASGLACQESTNMCVAKCDYPADLPDSWSLSGVVNSEHVASFAEKGAICFDYNGDGVGDSAISGSAESFDEAFARRLSDGNTALIFEFVGVESQSDYDRFTLNRLNGAPSEASVMTGPMYLTPSSYSEDTCLPIVSYPDSRITSGRLQAGPENVPVSFPFVVSDAYGVLDISLVDTQIKADITVGPAGVSARNGVFSGVVLKEEMDALFARMTDECDSGTPPEKFADLCAYIGAMKAAMSMSYDLHRCGPESCPEGYGTYILKDAEHPGDAASVCLQFTMAEANIIGYQP